ncbi:MAG: DUF4249 domain-containing protein [Crocinitomicaceae bacterium]|nr:DUF4249 domain-containing protein [Crocinitomicaceae bacterium]
MKRLLLIIAVTFLVLPACEKEITIDVEDAPQQLVIEGVLNNYLGESYILISKSVNLYGGTNFEKVSGASVSVEDEAGIVYVFNEESGTPGRYVLPTFQALPNTTYDLMVTVDGETITSTSTSPSIPKLDSLPYLVNPPAGFGQEDSTYFLFYVFTDDVTQENYYRVRPEINGDLDNNFYIGNDQLGNGEQVQAPFFATPLVVGDSNNIKVTLSSFDEANYTYLFSWANAADQSPFSAVPSNPVTNLEGSENVVGYFGAFMLDTMTLYLP